MAKNSVDAYGAVGKTNALTFDPEDLVVITDPNHCLFDRRALLPFDEATVRNIMAEGVHQSITITKDVETGKTIVVDGRRRVINAREANRRLIEAGRVPWRVPALVKREGMAVLTSAMVSTNEIRLADSPFNRAEKIARMRAQGRTNEEIALSVGLDEASIDAQFRLLECCMDVRDAAEAGTITQAIAMKLSKLPPDEQRAKLAEIKAAIEGKTGHDRSRAMQAAAAGAQARSAKPTKRDIAAFVEARLETATGEMAEAWKQMKAYMAGESSPEPETDPRQVTIDEAIAAN